MNQNTDRSSNQAGFSLVELLITMAIMGVAAVPMMMAYTRTWQATVAAKRLNTASMLARKNIERLIATTSYGNLQTGNFEGTFDSPYNQYGWERSVSKIEGSSPFFNAKHLKVKIYYPSVYHVGNRTISCPKNADNGCDKWDYSQILSKTGPTTS